MQVHRERRAAGAARALTVGSFVLGSFVLGVTGSLAGCGGSSSGGSAAASGTAAASSPGSSASTPVTGGPVTEASATGSPSRSGTASASAGAGKGSGTTSRSPSASVGGGGTQGDGALVLGPDPGGRLVTASHPVASPSARYSAALTPATVTGGVQTYVVVIRDAAGRELFRDTATYTADQGLAVAWLSTRDQLWLQSESATSHVDLVGAAWRKTAITPATVDTIPAEIKALTD